MNVKVGDHIVGIFRAESPSGSWIYFIIWKDHEFNFKCRFQSCVNGIVKRYDLACNDQDERKVIDNIGMAFETSRDVFSVNREYLEINKMVDKKVIEHKGNTYEIH